MLPQLSALLLEVYFAKGKVAPLAGLAQKVPAPCLANSDLHRSVAPGAPELRRSWGESATAMQRGRVAHIGSPSPPGFQRQTSPLSFRREKSGTLFQAKKLPPLNSTPPHTDPLALHLSHS